MSVDRRQFVGRVGLGVAVVLAPWVVWSAVQVATSERPVLQCVQCVYDFGVVADDAVVEHDFVLENRGKEAVAGMKAMPGCGCMAASLSGERAAAGDKVNLHVRMDVQSYHGAIEKKVYVTAGEGKAVTLVIRGVVK